ncbi:MAG: sulfite exporter TauE/SafE family protein [Pyrobaculum sp.]
MYLSAMLVGLLGGLLGPLVGVGGGVFIVPILNSLGVSFQTAAAVSLFSIIATSIVSVYNYRKIINFVDLWRFLLFSTISAALSAFLSIKFSSTWIYLVYGVYLVSIGFILLLEIKPRKRSVVLGYLLIFLGGFASSMFGIGGGTIYVPALMLAAGLDPKTAVAFSMGIILPTAISGTAIYFKFGVLDINLGVVVALGSSIGAYVSSKYIMPKLKSESIRKLFTTYVFVVGVFYLWKYFTLSHF